MSLSERVFINFKGGIVSPGYLKFILDAASAARVTHASFGLRQQLIIDVPAQRFHEFETMCGEKNINFVKAGDRKPNIVSSYPATNIFSQDSWLSEGVYKDIFDLFNYEPALKINICDSKQHLTPFFTGHLNWVSSDDPHYWYLYVRFPASHELYCWPELIYTNDIANISRQIEEVIISNETQVEVHQQPDGSALFSMVKGKNSCLSKAITDHMLLAVFHLPYYEGFNKDGQSSWLGIYRRDELFPVDFLRDICDICLETRVGQFYSTTWKSIIIKGIQSTDRNRWDQVLGKYRINVRHAANELNWQVEDQDEDGLILKRHVIRYFDKEDVRTYGLSFAVRTKRSSVMFGSVIISRQPMKNTSRLKSMERFDILHTRDFNPNSSDLVMYRKAVRKDDLGIYLVSLCKDFYARGSSTEMPIFTNAGNEQPGSTQAQAKFVHQCRHCLSIYDDANPTGTPFHEMPETYQCPLCDSPKEDFIEVDERTLTIEETV